METEKGVKTEGSPAPVTVDDKGVPWENRAKENERKLEAAQKEIDALKARVSSIPEPRYEEPSPEVIQEEKKKRLMEFVEDPDGYIERQITQKEHRKEVPLAQQWLKTQPQYSPEDDSRIVQIIQERELFNQSPMKRAQTAYEILKAEKLEREFSKYKQDSSRETSLGQAMGEGTGRSVKKENAPRRSDLLKELAQAEKAQDYRRAAEIGDMLSDVRE